MIDNEKDKLSPRKSSQTLMKRKISDFFSLFEPENFNSKV